MKNLFKALFFKALLFSFWRPSVYAQSTTITPGIVLPQMTTAQRTGLVSPINGMLVFDTNTQSYWFRQSGTWVNLAAGGGSSYWQLSGANGNEITNTNSGGFWSANSSTVLSGASTVNPPVSGSGTRLMWIATKSAFRVGTVLGTEWNVGNIGVWSFASGYGTIARGNSSTAIGSNTTAGGNSSTAMGSNTTASGENSIAMGFLTTASGENSTSMGYGSAARSYNATAIGYNTNASGDYSTAIGRSTAASGQNSTSMGNVTTASGYNSTSMGFLTTASGANSTAMGYGTTASGSNSTAMGAEVSTNSKNGAFIIGDGNPYNQGTTLCGVANQFVARFAGGYYLLTCGDTGSGNPSNNIRTGMTAGAGANAWSTISDSTKKEKLVPVNGEEVLEKIGKFRLNTWNYKGQDPKVFRHYGPMAQDFYHAFGKDALGSIGCDTLINQADFDGVNFTAIQALVKRTDELRKNNDELRAKNDELRARNEKMAAELAEIKQNQAAFKAEIWDEMKNMLKTKEGNVRETDKKFVVD